MVLASPEYAGPLRVPTVAIVRRPGIFHRALDVGPIAAQPGIVAHVLPFAIGLDDGAELPVGAGADDVEARAERQALAKGEAAVRQLVVAELGLAQAALQHWEEVRQRLLIVPDMPAPAFARAFADMLALPAP